MALVNLPVIQIDSANLPRLQAALRGFAANNPEAPALTDAQLYRQYVRQWLQAVVQAWEVQQAAAQAAAAAVPPPDIV